MAREKKVAEKDLTVEEKLKALYRLQTIYSSIDEIKLLRGELPLEVQDLESELIGISTRIENYKQEMQEIDSNIAQRKIEIENAHGLIEKYKEQQENVRNNREYDHLSKEIEYQTLNIELNEKKIGETQRIKEIKIKDIETSEELYAEKKIDFEHKRDELDDIINETKQKEEKLRDDAKKVEIMVEPRLLNAFKRIRKNARNGLAVVTVQRGACGGCFNNIPPQRQLDVRSNKKIIVCEYCGRIMIDMELAAEVDAENIAAAKKANAAAKKKAAEQQ